MREHGFRARCTRRNRTTADSRHGLRVYANLPARRFEVLRPDTVWVTDITYIWTLEGWLYLGVILDLFSHRIVGWSMSERIDRQLAMGCKWPWRTGGRSVACCTTRIAVVSMPVMITNGCWPTMESSAA